MAYRIRAVVFACLAAIFSAALQAQQSVFLPSDTAVQSPTAVSVQEPPAGVEGALHAMSARAAIVFAGEVLSVQHTDHDVLVRWRVTDAVRGPAAGSVFDLHEWPGLWSSGATRYTAGQRALVFLLSQSAAGYASPVDGADGIVPMRGDAAGSTLDLRWVSGHVLVTDAARLRPMQGRAAQVAPAAPLPAASFASGATSAIEVSAGDPARTDGAVVLGLLRAWQRTETAK